MIRMQSISLASVLSVTFPVPDRLLPSLYKSFKFYRERSREFKRAREQESKRASEQVSEEEEIWFFRGFVAVGLGWIRKMEVAHFIFGIFGNVTALFLFLSPIITFRRIILKKSTEDFSGVPYNMTLLNCLLSAWYGLPFVSPNNMLVWTINGTGALIEAVYVLIFLVYAPKKLKVRMFGLLALVSSVFAIVALISVLILHGHARKLFCGCAATIFSIFMYGSPLSIMRLVIKTKSVEFMPFFLSLFVFLCGTSWFIFGLLGHDPFIIIPNGCGSALGAVQLILYVIYRKNKGQKGANLSGEAMEMGHAKPSLAGAHNTEKKKTMTTNDHSANEQL